MNYTIVSIGDSITQGFQSFAVFDRGQEYSFPALIAKYNSGCFTPYKLSKIKYPGFPFNIEFLLNEMGPVFGKPEGLKQNTLVKSVKKLAKSAPAFTNYKAGTCNNLGIYGYTAGDVLERNFLKGTSLFYRSLLKLERGFPFLGTPIYLAMTLLDSITPSPGGFSRSRYKKFSSYNFAKVTYNTLCGDSRDKAKSQVDIACHIAEDALREGRQCLVTYWAGNNDVMGALLANDKDYISDPDEVLAYIKISLERLLKIGNTTVAFATIPELDEIPFIDSKTYKPIFPMYESMTVEAYNAVNDAVKRLNSGLRSLYNFLCFEGYEDRLCLVEMDTFFKELTVAGYEVVLADGRAIRITADYIGVDSEGKLCKGGFFSLDGVHPTSTGYAIIANQFVKAFNTMGFNLNEGDVNETAKADSLLNNPPALVEGFVDFTSGMRGVADKFNIFWLIRNAVLKQFDMNRVKK